MTAEPGEWATVDYVDADEFPRVRVLHNGRVVGDYTPAQVYAFNGGPPRHSHVTNHVKPPGTCPVCDVNRGPFTHDPCKCGEC